MLHEIIFDRDPYVAEWVVHDFEFYGDRVLLPDKWVGCNLVTEASLGSVFFFSYAEAEAWLNILIDGGVECMCPHCLLLAVLGSIGSGALACAAVFKLKILKAAHSIKQKYKDWKGKKWL